MTEIFTKRTALNDHTCYVYYNFCLTLPPPKEKLVSFIIV